ncbi:uncharacterized protein TRAVEDRAFT_97538, partial [Trametes versicolor FP-101664 SS1]|uniref:uncharacterized protein n=1 Tax=Trametes versicolor (strain FP-101664) TaxID=717944 RepID=UPI0004624974
AMRSGYKDDPTFRKVLEQPTQHRAFTTRSGLIYSQNRLSEEVLCIPCMLHQQQAIIELVKDRAHTALGHLGPQCTSEYVRRWFWW